MKKRIIWTLDYQPFIMGGNVNKPIGTEIGFIEEKSIGKGFRAFSFKTQKGTIKIAECTTGGIIGDSFKQIKEDIKNCSKKELTEQLNHGNKLKIGLRMLSNDKFFESYRY